MKEEIKKTLVNTFITGFMLGGIVGYIMIKFLGF